MPKEKQLELAKSSLFTEPWHMYCQKYRDLEYKELCTLPSIADFWTYVEYVYKPKLFQREFPMGMALHFMRGGITPCAGHPENKKGGTLNIMFHRKDVQANPVAYVRLMHSILMLMVGEGFPGHYNGFTYSKRINKFMYRFWDRDALEDANANDLVRKGQLYDEIHGLLDDIDRETLKGHMLMYYKMLDESEEQVKSVKK